MYTIKHAAEVTGLSPATLRAWEQRYGIVTPHRTEAGYRLYDDQAVRALTVMAALVAQGWSARQAAEEAQRRIAEDVATASPLAAPARLEMGRPSPFGTPGAAPNGPSAPPPTSFAPYGPTAQGPTGQGSPWSTGFPAADGLIDAAARLDVGRLGAVLDERFSIASFESVVDGWLMPSLVALGEAWAQGQVSVAGEHLVSYAVMRRLAGAYDAASSGATGPRTLVGLPPGSRHELGVLAFAVAARRAGLRAAYVGADLPADDWVTAVATHRARAVVLCALTEADLTALGSVVERLRAAKPDVLTAVGGAAQGRAPQGCLRLGHQIGAGAALLASALGRTAESR